MKKQKQTKFGRGTTLRQMIDELEYNGIKEITRIMPRNNGVFSVEYN